MSSSPHRSRPSPSSRRTQFTIGPPTRMTLEERVEQRNRTTSSHRRVSQHLHKLLNDMQTTRGVTSEQLGDLFHLVLDVLQLDSDLLVEWINYGNFTIAKSCPDFWKSIKQHALLLDPHPHQPGDDVDISSLPRELNVERYRPISPAPQESIWSNPSSASPSPPPALALPPHAPPAPMQPPIPKAHRDIADNLIESAFEDWQQIQDHTYTSFIASVVYYKSSDELFEMILLVGNERFGYDPSAPVTPPNLEQSPPTRGRTLFRDQLQIPAVTSGLTVEVLNDRRNQYFLRSPSPSQSLVSSSASSAVEQTSGLRHERAEGPTATVDQPMLTNTQPASVSTIAADALSDGDSSEQPSRARLTQIMAQDWPSIYEALVVFIPAFREARIERERQNEEAQAASQARTSARPLTDRLTSLKRSRSFY